MKKRSKVIEPEFSPVELGHIPGWWKVFEKKPGQRGYACADGWCGCGGGTASIIESVLSAGGYIEYMAAVNHWTPAILVHTKNYPGVAHFCDKMENLDPKVAVPGGHLDIFTAGIKCQPFTRAAGGKERNEQERMDAFQVLRWLNDLDVSRLVVENVQEFLDWGPLNKSGHPIKSRKGEMFNAWIAQLRAMNYTVKWRVLTACWYGDPTSRERLWIIAKKGNRKIFFPEPTHRDPNKPADMFNASLPVWPVARDIIDFNLPTKPVFGSALVPNTLARILAGSDKFVGKRLEFPVLPGLPKFTPRKAKKGGRLSPYAEQAHRFHYLNLAIRAAQGLPLGKLNKKYVARVSPEAVELILKSVRFNPSAVEESREFAIKLYGTSTTKSIDHALPSITAQGGHIGFVVVNNGGIDGYERNHGLHESVPAITTQPSIGMVDFVISQQSEGAPRSIDRELPAVTQDGAINKISVIARQEESFLIAHFGEHENKSPRTHSIDQSFPTVTQRGAGDLVAQVSYLVSGEHYNGDDRVAPGEKEMPTLTTNPDWGVVETREFMLGFGGRSLDPSSSREPTKTQTANDRPGLVESHFIFPSDHRGEPETGRHTQPITIPIRSITTREHWTVVGTYLTEYHNHDDRDRTSSVDEELPTLDTSNRYTIAFLAAYYGTAADGQRLDQSIRALTTKDRFMLVIPGIGYMDWRYRMLVLKELKKAHSFPDDFDFADVSYEEGKKMVGNSWPIGMGTAVVSAALLERKS
jgi:DNA (cytosine-5)-methyltransferase 1